MALSGQGEHKLVLLAGDISRYEAGVRGRTIGAVSQPEEKGAAFAAAIPDYIGALRDGTAFFDPCIQEVAALAAKHKSGADLFWLRLMCAIEPLSLRPSKKHAALLIDDGGRLVRWDVARLMDGVAECSGLYLKNESHHRGAWIRCAEQMCVAGYLGVRAKPVLSVNPENMAQAGAAFFQRLRRAVHQNDSLQKMTLVSRFPCNQCVELFVDERAARPAIHLGRMVVLRDNRRVQELTADTRQPDRAEGRLKRFGRFVRVVFPLQMGGF